jgi:hypothetical protein
LSRFAALAVDDRARRARLAPGPLARLDVRLAGGIIGSTNPHSPSVRSLGYRSPCELPPGGVLLSTCGALFNLRHHISNYNQFLRLNNFLDRL